MLAVVAEWDPSDPNRRLRKLSEEKSRRALEELEDALQQRLEAPEGAADDLKARLSGDVVQLREALDGVVNQRQRITSTRRRVKDNPDQLLIDLGDIADADELKAVRRQLDDNRRYWEQRLQAIDTDLEHEPDRIRRTFELRTQRVEPAGAIYLWPQEADPQEAEPQGAPL